MHSILRLLRCGSARVHRGDRVASFSEGGVRRVKNGLSEAQAGSRFTSGAS